MADTSGSLRLPKGIGSNPEFQSFLVRLGVWAFGIVYVLVTAATGYRQVDVPSFLLLVSIFAIVYLALFASVFVRPEWELRRYVTISLDIVAITLGIYFTRTVSPFNLLYIWIFISAGTRYGIRHLVAATAEAVIAYSLVMAALDQWTLRTQESLFFLLLLVLLPVYQYSLLREVKRAREEAEQANKAKGDFLAFMTHELRTPLTGVIGMSDLLKTTRLDSEQRDYVQAIASSAHVLSALIGDVLDLSKIDASRLKLEQAPFAVRAVVREVCGALEGQALSKGLEMICDVSPEVPAAVVGDQLRVRQILFNLLGNAVKFTESGQVEVRVSARQPEAGIAVPHLLLEIADTGIGIPAQKLADIFESFRQADDSTTRRYGGSGLGTTIARDLTLLMNGAIGVESAEGEGSRFWVRLPLPADSVRQTQEPARRLSGRHALVLEPNPTQRKLVCAALRREGVTCHGARALEDLEKRPAKEGNADFVVIADIPGGLDMDATRTRLGDLIGGKPCCLFLTYAARRSVRHGDGVGCLPKPFLAEDLVQAAEELLGLVAPAAQQKQGTSRLAGGSTASVEALRLLVAEDNAIAAKVVTRFLRKDGYRVTQLGDGEQALEEALRGDYAMAIVDLRMPKVDGIEFTKRYRATVPDGRLRIVALTANASEDVKNTCLEAGMDGFLSKPVNPDLLRETIERLARLDTVINRDAAGRERPISIPAGKSEVERHVHGARE